MSERSEEMLYLVMKANQEHVREMSKQVEHDRLEVRLTQARLSNDAPLQESRPYTGTFTDNAWRMQSWQGAGW